VRVSRKAAGRVASGHPWIFASDVLERGQAEPGDAVLVTDPNGKTLGTAHYSNSSQISLRLVSDRAETIDRAFYFRRLRAAEAYRKRVVTNSNAYRLVHGEADQLPGLVIDRYGDYISMQTLDQGMDRAKPEIVSAIEELFRPLGIVERNDVPVRKRESLPLQTGVLAGEVPGIVPVEMNGLKLHADLVHGQKTGIFLDQRENYLAAARYARGRALDCFTSSGGFALHIAARCDSVEAVDSSEASLKAAEFNRAANQISNVEFREADVFDVLAGYASAHRRVETVVLDPPAFAKSRDNLDRAVTGYKEINRRALELLGPGGVLIVATASLDTGRVLRVLERRTQSQDHPILLTVPETLYLKCLILEVM
jgi:23S rRNA (cytosine1962-C5)-methyltransferase